jgi:hypothetical protein
MSSAELKGATMLDAALLGKLAAAHSKTSVPQRRGRAGRTVKGSQIPKQLHAAGSPRMPGGVIGYPRGQSV